MTAPAAARVLDEMHRPAFHVMPLARCGPCLVIGGFDAQAMGYVAPSVMRDAGYASGTAVVVGTVLQTGGVIGTLSLGWFIERHGFARVLLACFACATIAVGLIGSVAHAFPWLLAAVFVGGFCIVGGQPAVNALAGRHYPTSLRSTGIGWSLGVGRVGSVLGPLVGGQLIALGWSNDALFHAAAVPVLCSAVFVIGLASVTRRRGAAAPNVA
ncbi:MFS transporter [Burkholderia sp. BDU5]|uniref:MFS transporter n=1 Tax=Burkholderia sp. BDU5 TaxID=1385590 RepID=UPI000A54E214